MVGGCVGAKESPIKVVMVEVFEGHAQLCGYITTETFSYQLAIVIQKADNLRLRAHAP